MVKRKRQEAAAQPSQLGSAYHRLDQDTASYLADLKQRLDSAECEDHEMVANRIFEEVAGKEVAVASEATGSRTLEAAAAFAGMPALLSFAEAVFTTEEMPNTSASPFGSHVAERVLERLAAGGSASEAAGVERALAAACSAVRARLYEFATDRFATHVARALLCALAGRNVLPAPSAARRASGAAFVRAAKEPRAGLAGRLAGRLVGPPTGEAAPAPPPARRALLAGFADSLLGDAWGAEALQDLALHPYGSPWLQALLEALRGDSPALERLIPRLLGCGGGGDGGAGVGGLLGPDLDASRVHGLMQDSTGSHLMEAVFAAATGALRSELDHRVLRGALPKLAAHPAANFAVQAALAAATRPEEVKGALRAMRNALPGLLLGRRGGVVAALVAAAGRTGGGGAEVVSALASALAALASADPSGAKCAAEVLLTLDAPGARLAAPDIEGGAVPPRLSPVGCAILASLLRLPEAATSVFATSLAALPGPALAAIGMDAGGSRALEAFLDSAAPAKAKRTVVRKLAGSHAALGASPGGSHVVQAAYACSAPKEQEVIAGELAAMQERIAATPRGLMLLSRLGIADFKANAAAWRRRQASAAVLRGKFEDLLGKDAGLAEAPGPRDGDFDGTSAPAPRTTKVQKREKGGAVPAADGHSAPGHLAGPAKRRKRDRDAPAVPAVEVMAGAKMVPDKEGAGDAMRHACWKQEVDEQRTKGPCGLQTAPPAPEQPTHKKDSGVLNEEAPSPRRKKKGKQAGEPASPRRLKMARQQAGKPASAGNGDPAAEVSPVVVDLPPPGPDAAWYGEERQCPSRDKHCSGAGQTAWTEAKLAQVLQAAAAASPSSAAKPGRKKKKRKAAANRAG